MSGKSFKVSLGAITLALVAALAAHAAGNGVTQSAGSIEVTAGLKAAGTRVTVPTKTIGLVNIVRASEAAQRLEQGATDAAHVLGWKMIAIDAAGDPAASQRAFVSLINQKVDAIIDLSNSTGAIRAGLKMAAKAGIPVINIGGVQDPDPNISGMYAASPVNLTHVLTAYMKKHLKKNAKIAIQVFPLLLDERLRIATFKADLKGTGITIVDTHQSDFANLAQDAQTAARAAIAAHPDLDAFWGDTDATMPPIANELKSQGKCGKIQNYNYYGDKVNLQAIKNGCATAVVESPLTVDGWAAIDQFAQFFARHKKISQIPYGWPQLDKLYGLELRNGASVFMVDKTNLPPAGQFVPPKYDFVKFFSTKWNKEFGTKPIPNTAAIARGSAKFK